MAKNGYFSFKKVSKTLFLALFCLKTKSENNIKILAKTMDLPLSKNAYQATLLINVFMVKKGYFSVKKVSKHYLSLYFA